MILVDYTQVALASILMFQKDLKTGSDEKIVDLIRHVILSSIVSNKKKFGKEYGEIVICCDSKNYWRKDFFPHYKAHRAKAREESDLNWKLIFDTISKIRDELKQNFPYKVIDVPRVEADDIIGVLTKYTQDNDLVAEGLMEEPQPVLILSSDKDNVQLQKYKNVRQWSPMQKKFVKPEGKAAHALIEKICCGDSGDGVPNIMSPDDIFLQEGVRQKSFRKARLEEFYEKGIDACKTAEERRNYQRNELVVSYEKIPQEYQEQIIATYKEQPVVGNRAKIMTYLMANRCRNLMDELENF